MHRRFVSSVTLHAVMVLCAGNLAAAAVSSAYAGAAGPGPGVTGNDTGGIIQWFPGIHHYYKTIAVEHCARYYRWAGISSVRFRYGEYIGFQCVYDRGFDPRKMGWPPVY